MTGSLFFLSSFTRPLVLTCALMILVAAAAKSEPAPVAFDWFEYTGRDERFTPPLTPGSFRNPVLAGFYPDPSICRVGDDFYLINSSFAFFPGIPIFRSHDLVTWTQLGHVVDRPGQLKYDGLGVSRGIFAPALSYHDGTFYVVCTMVDAGGNFVMTAKNPAGPWSDPIWLKFDGIDPSLFFTDDGRAFLVNNGPPEGKPLYEGHRAIWIQQFDPATQQLIGPRSVIVNGGVELAKKPVWIEGPHLFQRHGWFYLSCAEGGTGDDHSQVILRSQSVTGPFVPWDKNPILTQRDLDGTVPGAVTSTGHADLVIGRDDNWWAVFLGCRPFAGRFYATGRETFLLPATWTSDDWPVILPPGTRVPSQLAAPKRSSARSTSDPAPVSLTGNFTWRDEFENSSLSPLWVMLRAPHETWWNLTQKKGYLDLTPRRDTLSGAGNPSFLGRRLQHARFDASTALEPPETSGVSAGLVAFQNETHNYYLGVLRTEGNLTLFLERLNGRAPERIAQASLPIIPHLELRISGDDRKLAFAYQISTGEWQTLVADADATVITTQAAGGFVGAMVGLHTRIEAP
jgi:xylan 1,4-beta-xylosidase